MSRRVLRVLAFDGAFNLPLWVADRQGFFAAQGLQLALDFTPTVLILTPVLMPVVLQAGIDPVYFGILFIMNNAIGLITPPVGTVLNVVCGVARISMDDAFKGVMPFFLAQLGVLFLLVLFPDLVLVPLKWFMH